MPEGQSNEVYPYTKISLQGDIIEKTELLKKNSKGHIKKISASEFVYIETGEIREFEKKAETRADTKKSLFRTFRNIRALVNTNCQDGKKIKWITLTYAENMRDTERLYSDFVKFWKRFKRRWGKAEYISVAEPQKRGAWHLHLIVIFPNHAPFIPNEELRECWGHGFVNVQKVDGVDNLGAYLSAYLADVEVPDDTENADEKTVDGKKKKFVKGARLSLYPAGFQIYRYSRGIKKPSEFFVNPHQAEDITKEAAMTFQRVYEFETEDGFKQKVRKTYYNRKRKKD